MTTSTPQSRYQTRQRLAGRCQKCGKALAKGHRSYCPKHRDAYNANERKRYAADPQGARQAVWQNRNIKQGRCLICGKKRPKRSKRLCTYHLDQRNARARRARACAPRA